MIGRVIRWGGLDWVGFREVDRGAFFLSVAALFPAPFDAGRGVGFFGSSLFRQLHEDFLPGLKKRAASEDGSGFRVREFLMTDGAGVRAYTVDYVLIYFFFHHYFDRISRQYLQEQKYNQNDCDNHRDRY